MKISFEIAGEAVGKGRPRFSSRCGVVRAFTPKKTSTYEYLVMCAAANAMKDVEIFKSAVHATMLVFVSTPKSWPRKKRAEAISGALRPTVKPDSDNIAKCILDACNNIVFDDDKQVCDLVVRKFYAEKARVEVFFTDEEGHG